MRTELNILLLAYNRLEAFRKAIEHLAEAEPHTLYIVFDGPKDSETDRRKVDELRNFFSDYRYPYPTQLNFFQHNRGTKEAMETALDWFFKRVDHGVILEDDCLVDSAFLTLAESVIGRYSHDPTIWGLGGSNLSSLSPQLSESYSVIGMPVTWGWATWADRWTRHREIQRNLSRESLSLNAHRWPHLAMRHAFERHVLHQITETEPPAWDYFFSWSVISSHGKWLLANANLVENIGFGPEASNRHPRKFRKSTHHIEHFQHPMEMSVNAALEKDLLRRVYGVIYPLWLNPIRNFFRVAKVRALLKKLKTGEVND